MNAPEMTRRLDVAHFVDEVRAALCDLPQDDREELIDGLEADLTERLQDSGDEHTPVSALGSPAEYAAELRAAAGMPATAGGSHTSSTMRLRSRVGAWQEQGVGRLQEAATTPLVLALLPFLRTVRPVWWVARAWVGLQLLDALLGSWPHSWMISFHGYLLGALLWLAASILSVQIGRGVWWPANASAWRRSRVNVACSAIAVLSLPVVFSSLPSAGFRPDYGGGYAHPGVRASPRGLSSDGERVHNIYPYDAQGKPLVGVQLFDEEGNPLAIGPAKRYDQGLVTYPWQTVSTGTELPHVYPLPAREERRRVWERDSDVFASDNPPAVPLPPFVQAPVLPELPATSLQAFREAVQPPAAQPPAAQPPAAQPPPPNGPIKKPPADEQRYSGQSRQRSQDPSSRRQPPGGRSGRNDSSAPRDTEQRTQSN